MSENFNVIMIFGVFFVGCLLAVAYYFARFFFREGTPEQLEETKRDQLTKQSADQLSGQVAREKVEVLKEPGRLEGLPTTAAPPSTSTASTPKPTVTSTPKSTATTTAPTPSPAHTPASTSTPKPAPPLPEQEATLTDALKNTRSHWFGRLQGLFTSGAQKKQIIEAVEEILYTADVGAETADYFIKKIEQDWSGAKEDMFSILEKQILELIGQKTFDPAQWLNASQTHSPQVWMVVGVNGAGKTTSIGKLANQARTPTATHPNGMKVLVAAADTFRAAAQDQLKVWVERSGADFHSPANVTDPAAVAYSALEKAKSQKYDLLIVDTAGRLHTQVNLMEELKKIQRTLKKLDPAAPQQTIAVLDANSGQNALIQAREFNAALQLSAVILTKMDGTAKGGVILGVSHTLNIPTVFVGIGEKINDLKPFNPVEYTNALVRP